MAAACCPCGLAIEYVFPMDCFGVGERPTKENDSDDVCSDLLSKW